MVPLAMRTPSQYLYFIDEQRSSTDQSLSYHRSDPGKFVEDWILASQKTVARENMEWTR